MATVIIRLPDKTKHMLELIAHRQTTTVSDLVRQAVEGFVQQSQQQTAPANSLLELGQFAEQQACHLDQSQFPTDVSTTFKEWLYRNKNDTSE